MAIQLLQCLSITTYKTGTIAHKKASSTPCTLRLRSGSAAATCAGPVFSVCCETQVLDLPTCQLQVASPSPTSFSPYRQQWTLLCLIPSALVVVAATPPSRHQQHHYHHCNHHPLHNPSNAPTHTRLQPTLNVPRTTWTSSSFLMGTERTCSIHQSHSNHSHSNHTSRQHRQAVSDTSEVCVRPRKTQPSWCGRCTAVCVLHTGWLLHRKEAPVRCICCCFKAGGCCAAKSLIRCKQTPVCSVLSPAAAELMSRQSKRRCLCGSHDPCNIWPGPLPPTAAATAVPLAVSFAAAHVVLLAQLG